MTVQATNDNDNTNEDDLITDPAPTTPPPADPPKTDPPVDEAKETLSLADARKLKRENQRLRNQRNEALETLNKFEGLTPEQVAELQDTIESTKEQQETLEQTYRTNLVQARLEAACTRLGAVEAEVVGKLIDADKIEWENGVPTNIADLVEDVLEDKPYLKTNPTSTSRRTNESRDRRNKPTSVKELDFSSAYNMTDEEFRNLYQGK